MKRDTISKQVGVRTEKHTKSYVYAIGGTTKLR